MSFPGSTDFDVSKAEAYHASSMTVPASGFLTPPYNLEQRRDSVASLQSSISSFASCISDYSGPVTPSGPHNPMTEEGYADVMSYDFGHDMQSQQFHGLPMSQPSKHTTPEQNAFGTWHLVSHPTETSEPLSTPFAPQLMLPAEDDFLHTRITEDGGLGSNMTSDVDSAWINVSASFPLHFGRQWDDRGLDEVIPVEHLQPWPTAAHSDDPSVAMSDFVGDYTPVPSVCFPGSDSFDNSSFPQSPQEARETSPLLKQGPDAKRTKRRASRLTRSMHITPRGGKTVKKEKRSSSPDGTQIAFKLEGCHPVYDEAGNVKIQPSHRRTSARFACNYPGCTSHFRRQEHLKRHEKKHTNECFTCKICGRDFNRNDNCRQHMWTHVAQPGKKTGRNHRYTLEEVESYCVDPVDGPKLIQKLRREWKKACKEAGIAEEMACAR